MCALAITGNTGSAAAHCSEPWRLLRRGAVYPNSALTGSVRQARPGLSLHLGFSERKQTDPETDGNFLTNKPTLRLRHVQEEAENYLSGSQHEIGLQGSSRPQTCFSKQSLLKEETEEAPGLLPPAVTSCLTCLG